MTERCSRCGKFFHADEMSMDDFTEYGGSVAYWCSVCDEAIASEAEEAWPKVREMIDNAMLRQSIKFDFEHPPKSGV